jgi:uncharacterized cofD-like protein
MDLSVNKNIVVIGGGTGSFTVLSGLKKYTSNLTAIVNMADDGGSTGQLRDELGVLPPGDVRQCLVALSSSPKLRDLFNYRFTGGSFEGHAFGNLFLTALEKMTGSFAEAVDIADEVLRVKGRVVPITLENVQLVMKKPGSQDIIGEYKIGNMAFKINEQRPILELSPRADINPDARQAIIDADFIVIAPGNLYGSLAPALLVDGVEDALLQTRAKVLYVCNLVTKPGQTDNFSVNDFAGEIERFMKGRRLDIVLYNTKAPEKRLLNKYQTDHEYLVRVDKDLLANSHFRAVGTSLISNKEVVHDEHDKISAGRSLIRHDSDILAKEIIKLID